LEEQASEALFDVGEQGGGWHRQSKKLPLRGEDPFGDQLWICGWKFAANEPKIWMELTAPGGTSSRWKSCWKQLRMLS